MEIGMRYTVFLGFCLFLCLCLSGCMPPEPPYGRDGGELFGRGYVHYRSYPDRGHGYCGWEEDYRSYGKMVAAVSESIHDYYRHSLCGSPRYAYVRSVTTGREVRVRIVDQGGVWTNDFGRQEQHIMDLSEEAFRALDVDGSGHHTGRIYVTWELAPVR
jgi:hypothetical protein